MYRRKRKKQNDKSKQKKPESSKVQQSLYIFDKFGKPTIRRWKPNKICKLDDFGEINYNTL
jgi:hypothetical protein